MHFSWKTFQSCLVFCLFLSSAAAQADYVRIQEPEYLSFEELQALSKNPRPGGALQNKLERFWKTPIINNEAWFRGVRPVQLTQKKIGPVLSVTTWNVEKSFQIENLIRVFKDSDAFLRMVDNSKINPRTPEYKKTFRQRLRLIQSHILVLQEMDIGHKRSGYRNAAKELAKALDMNYAYGAEQLEVDPISLGTEKILADDGSEDIEMTKNFVGDPKLYKGIFGSAVLSKYPIKNVEVFQLVNQPYDWYAGEKFKPAFVEKSRRLGTKLLFLNEITREMKVGGRIYFRVDLDVPELPEKTLTIINVHLEIKCQPKGREHQMREILSYIQDIKNPVLLLGDFNSAPTDISPTSAKRIIARSAKNPNTWINAAITFLTPYGPVNVVRNTSNLTVNLQDPLAKDIKILAPNRLKPLFEMIEDFRFSDGGAFGFRGDPERSINLKRKKLANSNHRDFKGFKTTFQVRRPIAAVLGKLRLDWVFVKSYLKDPVDVKGPYRFAPHYGETLEELNTNLLVPISDHHPNIVELPFEEPVPSADSAE